MSKHAAKHAPKHAAPSDPAAEKLQRMGIAAGLGVGAVVGLAYGQFRVINDLTWGPIPSPVMGAIYGLLLGFVAGTFVGAAGRRLLCPRGAAGFVAGVVILAIGRLADATGEPLDKIMDIVAGGLFWGSMGAVLAVALAEPGAETPGEDPPAGE